MKVQVPKKQLADTLGHVERIIPTRSSNPGLSLIKIEITENELVFSGSNMEIDIQARLKADVEGIGQVALPAHVFSQVVKSLPGELVMLTFNDVELEISSGNYSTKLQLVEPGSAPEVDFPSQYGGEFDGASLVTALSSVRYAAAVAEYQAIFRGVKLELSDRKMRAVATDGFRLAYYHIDESSGLEGEVIIPARSVDEVIKLLSKGSVRSELLQGQQLSLANETFQLNLKLMEGTFPEYDRVIPNQFPVSITLESDALSQAVSRVAVMADKTANNRVDLFIKEGLLQITAEGTYGRSQEALEVSQEGSDSEIALAFNAKYLEDALAPVGGEMRVAFSGTTTPSVVTDLDNPSYLAMVVPLRTG
ncbi:MAG: DNA polymerase III subunit beta [Trueperaceae bacterium]|nr:MAG: DNA polymerase III subunit beta [Trueperaceae bacterium]